MSPQRGQSRAVHWTPPATPPARPAPAPEYVVLRWAPSGVGLLLPVEYVFPCGSLLDIRAAR